MNRSPLITAFPIALALAGCGHQPESQSSAADNALVVAAPENAAMPEPDGAPSNVAPSGEPTSAAAIPAAFQGRWGLVANDCDPARDDNKGLMTVAADSLKFYESRGTVKQVTIASPTKLTADLAFTGEGQTWDKAITFTLFADGKTLVREETDPATALRYHRCNA